MTGNCKPLWLIHTDHELRCGPVLTTQMDGNPLSLQLIISPFLQVKVVILVNYIAWSLLLVAQSSSVERRGALDRVRHLLRNTRTKLGRSQPRAGFAGRLFHSLTSLVPGSGERQKRNSRQQASLVMSRRSRWVSWSDSLREQPANEEDPNDASSPCAPRESKFPDRLSVSSGLGEASEHAVATCFSAEVSDPLSCPLCSLTNFSKAYCGSLVEKIHVMRNTCPSRSLRLTFSLVSSWYRVLRTKRGRDETGRRDNANPRPSRELNGQ